MTTTTSTAIAVAGGSALEPRSIDEGLKIATLAAKSGLFGVKGEADAFMRMATGASLGLSAVESLRGLYVIGGKVGISADLMKGLCQRSPACEYFRLVESSPESVTFETKRRGEPAPTRLTWTMEKARKAGLLSNQMYAKYPEEMLRARCASALARLVYPDALHGLYTPEELNAGEVEAQVVESAPAHEDTDPGPLVPPDLTRWRTLASEFCAAVDAEETEEAVTRRVEKLKGIGGIPAEVLGACRSHAVAAVKRLRAKAQAARVVDMDPAADAAEQGASA